MFKPYIKIIPPRYIFIDEFEKNEVIIEQCDYEITNKEKKKQIEVFLDKFLENANLED